MSRVTSPLPLDAACPGARHLAAILARCKPLLSQERHALLRRTLVAGHRALCEQCGAVAACPCWGGEEGER